MWISCILGKETFTFTAIKSQVALLSQPTLYGMALVFFFSCVAVQISVTLL